MSEQAGRNERAVRVSRPFTVRISENVSAEQTRWNIVTAQDISVSGILFNYDHYIEPGTRVRFRISLPICEPVECEGRVVRNVIGLSHAFVNPEPAVSAVAAVFLDLSEKDQQVMAKFMAQYEEVEPVRFEQVKPVSKPTDHKAPRSKRIDRSLPAWIRKYGQKDWTAVAMNNISATGALIRSAEPLETGSGMALRILLPFSTIPVMCWGVIARAEERSRPDSGKKEFEVGIQFTVMIDEAARQKLQELSEQLGQ